MVVGTAWRCLAAWLMAILLWMAIGFGGLQVIFGVISPFVTEAEKEIIVAKKNSIAAGTQWKSSCLSRATEDEPRPS